MGQCNVLFYYIINLAFFFLFISFFSFSFFYFFYWKNIEISFHQKLYKVQNAQQFMETDTKLIMNELDLIKNTLDKIKEKMVEKDEIMIVKEFEAYKKSFDKNNLISLEDSKKQLNL